MQSFKVYFSTILLLLTSSTLAGLLSCENINQNSEWDPDNAWRTGSWGQISRSNGKATKSLCVVTYPEGLSGKTCHLVFENPEWASGSRRGMVHNLGSANIDEATWNHPGEAHNGIPIGTFQLEGESWPWSPATWVEFGSFQCPDVAGGKGYAISPVWDEDYVSWYTPNGGLKVQYDD